jgi:hypothetical protein
LGPRYNTLNNAVIARDGAIAARGIVGDEKNVAGVNLKAENSGYFTEINTNCKKKVGGNPKSVRTIFGMPQKTGKQPDMKSEGTLVAAADKIRDGDAIMVTDGYVLNVGTKASDVLPLSNIYKGLLNDVSTADSLINTCELAVQEAMTLALETANDIPRQVGNFYRAMTKAQIRVKKGLFGATFKASKVLTLVKIVVNVAPPLSGEGVSGRIGELLTKKGKPSKAGVKGTTDSMNVLNLLTTAAGATKVILRKVGLADIAVPITIVPGTAQKIVVTMVAGISSLGV